MYNYNIGLFRSALYLSFINFVPQSGKDYVSFLSQLMLGIDDEFVFGELFAITVTCRNLTISASPRLPLGDSSEQNYHLVALLR